jgi:hypothetical protein
MTPKVGHLVSAFTADLIGNDSARKYHLCICSRNSYYLYLCRRGFPGDFAVRPTDFEELTEEIQLVEHVSFISLSRVIRVLRFARYCSPPWAEPGNVSDAS